MLLVRRFEEKVLDLFTDGAFGGHFHVAIGHEATTVGAMCALSSDDLVFSNHRNHGHVLARGADPARSLAEILGRSAGLLGGRGGTFHLADPAIGMPHTSALVGASAALAAGAAHGARLLGRSGVGVGFIGDAALEEGIVVEAMTIARKWSLPVVFICEDNRRRGEETFASSRPVALPQALGLHSMTVDGGDVLALHGAVQSARRHCTEDKGPVFVDAAVPLWPGNEDHWPEQVTGATDLMDAVAVSAPRRAHAYWFGELDPVLRFCRDLLRSGEATEDSIARLDRNVRSRIDDAATEALSSDPPSPASALDDIFV